MRNKNCRSIQIASGRARAGADLQHSFSARCAVTPSRQEEVFVPAGYFTFRCMMLLLSCGAPSCVSARRVTRCRLFWDAFPFVACLLSALV
eukprot:5306627-Prymnesium_polylepis.1